MDLSLFLPPLLVTVLSIPLFFKKVPPNALYGLRTPDTMSSERAWYRTNKRMGAAGIVGGAIWLLAVVILTGLGVQSRYTHWIGIAALLISIAIAVNLPD